MSFISIAIELENFTWRTQHFLQWKSQFLVVFEHLNPLSISTNLDKTTISLDKVKLWVYLLQTRSSLLYMAYKLMDWRGVMFLSDSHSDGTHSLHCIRCWDTHLHLRLGKFSKKNHFWAIPLNTQCVYKDDGSLLMSRRTFNICGTFPMHTSSLINLPSNKRQIKHGSEKLKKGPCVLFLMTDSASGKLRDRCGTMHGGALYVSLEHKSSSTGIFIAIANNTLYGSKLYIFLLCQKSLGY